MKNPKTSVIIRTYNEEKQIEKCLKAVFNQKTKYSFEVIIVDSESDDKTLEIASKFPVKIIKIKKKAFTYGKSLNIGCKAAKGEYLVFLSAHAIPVGTEWLDTLIENFKNLRVAGVYGKEIPAEDCNPLSKRLMLAHWKDKRKVQSKNHFFVDSNSAILRNIWFDIGFNEQLIGSEDHDWAKRAQVKGYLIIYEPKAVVIHSHNESFKQIYRRYYRNFYSVLLINDRKIDLNLLILGFYYFFHDVRYILKNRYSLFWIVKSFLSNLLLFIAALSAFFRRLV